MSRLLTHEHFLERKYIRSLDGLRAIAVLAVVLNHVRGHDTFKWLSGGTNGVTIFFVLSGFLITTLCLREEDARKQFGYGGFFVRRVFRILPLYLLVVGVYGLLVLVLNEAPGRRSEFVDALPWYLSPFPEGARVFVGNPPFQIAWSLGFEEKFYVVWPLLAFVAMATVPKLRLPVAVSLIAAIVLIPTSDDVFAMTFNYSEILAGCVIALLLHERRSFVRLRVLGHSRVIVGALAALVALQVLHPVIESFEIRSNYTFTVVTAMMLVGVLVSRSWLNRLLEHRTLVFIGGISYAIYLTHQLGLNAAERIVPAGWGTPGNILTIPIGMALVIPFSYLLNLIVERPLINVGRRLTHRPPRRHVSMTPSDRG